MFASILSGIAYGLRLAADIFDSENSAEMVAAAKAKKLQALKDKLTADTATGQIDKVRNDLAP